METTSHTHSLTDLLDKLHLAKPAHDILAIIVATASIWVADMIPDADKWVDLISKGAVAGATVAFMLAGTYLRVKESRLAEKKVKHLEEMEKITKELKEDL